MNSKSTITIEEITSFIENFPFLKSAPEDEICIDTHFIDGIMPSIKESQREASVTAPNLNIFKGIGVGTDEVRNCKILAWFMKPEETHAQGSLFMEIFFEQELREFLPYALGGYFNVSTEIDFGDNGRVDINIVSRDFWVIIEAKINAGEQDSQLKRYNNVIASGCSALGINSGSTKVIYLTLSGCNPTSGKADLCISWLDISKVLFKFAERANNAFVSNLAQQYANYLQYITGETNG
jgi:hypothetical protein